MDEKRASGAWAHPKFTNALRSKSPFNCETEFQFVAY